MRVFACPSCAGPLFFDNLRCACGTEIAYRRQFDRFESADAVCANRSEIDCNWAVDDPSDCGLCDACSMTEIIPDTLPLKNRTLWAETESAKRWVLASMARWGWFTVDDKGRRPAFHLLSEHTRDGGVPVTMGHASGLVTINVIEADRAERTIRREQLGEQFRTMIGHFRHELGHFVFERLAERNGFLDAFRDMFGNERADYAAALQRHYGDGPPDSWENNHVTPYAASHPHEDWAESFAHLLHLADIVDSYLAAGLTSNDLTDTHYDAYADRDSQHLITLGVHLGIALNHVNRAMGLPDIYPFVLTPAIRQKLAFVHRHIHTVD